MLTCRKPRNLTRLYPLSPPSLAMAGRLLPLLRLLLLLLPSASPAAASFRGEAAAAADSGRCPGLEDGLPPFAGALRQSCRVSAEGYPAEEVDGEKLLRELGGKEEYAAVLFYASWCPFSQRMRPVFDDLSSMFPQIKHLAVEESNVMPAFLSRYGVRSLPSIIIAHGSYAFWPLGSKDLDSLVNFYTAVTGQEPVAYIGPRKWSTSQSTHYAKLWNSSISEAVKREPYLAFSILFICLRIFLFFFPKFFTLIKGFWIQYFRHINLGILAKLTHLLECVPHAVDVRKMWIKWRLMVGAKNARVWASSLTSVSLGGQSLPRAAVLD
ncbi:5'-adenylylsulfate reductase-like 6 isoform X2 [Phragmites australis]|uniref:5'-adenylylsulfate reductase-like 6 isoform X2 n=1 Tax=Phragmites australis TaxID=29695 RepID=UPI002D7864B0|nr:5'-adenylylsulfate reductase-like 6 isoform X2 [Phragmites australis]